MTATAHARTARPVPGELRRVLDVARVQAFNWPMQFGFPLGMFAVVMLIAVVSSVLGGGGPADAVSLLLGGFSLTVWACVSLGLNHSLTIAHVFPLTLGLGSTRWTFSLATTLVAVVQGAALGGLLAQVERATGGWGSGERFFGLGELSPAGSWLAHSMIFLVCAALGVVLGAVFLRWGMPALWVLVSVVGVLVAVVVAVGIVQDWPAAAGALLADVPVAVLLAAGPLVLVVGLGLAGYAVLRRTPG